MRRPVMAGNWKMNKTVEESAELVAAIRRNVAAIEMVDRILCPSFVSLPVVRGGVQGTSIAVGAQNMHWEESGAYTGEISAPMLKHLVSYVIIGHSERRQFFGETDQTVNKKLRAAIAHEIQPILCVGESLQQNDAGETHEFIVNQITVALAGISQAQMHRCIIAYEPIWAIGTGKAATPQQAQDVCSNTVRATVAALFDESTAQAVRVLYGGSTKPDNIAEIMQQPDIDGALIGGASLDTDSYSDMIRITAQLYASIHQ